MGPTLWGQALPPEIPLDDRPPVPPKGKRDPLINTHPRRNPCLEVFGKGLDGATCKTCSFLRRKHYDKTYVKCVQRPNTNGPGTDHRVNWPACGKYQLTEGKML